jgi:hypothetical protein
VEAINLSSDYLHIRKEQNIAEWKKVDKCENAIKEIKEAAEVMNMEKPLRDASKEGAEWIWNKEQEEAVRMSKEKLIPAEVLAHPRSDVPFDANNTGLGAVLSQKGNDGNLRRDLYFFASRTLNVAEKNYSATALECLANVWACEIFRTYISGTNFGVITDHRALVWLFAQSKTIKQNLLSR